MATASRRDFFGMSTALAGLAAGAKVYAADSPAQGLSSLTKSAQPITAQEHAGRIAKVQSLMQQRKVAALIGRGRVFARILHWHPLVAVRANDRGADPRRRGRSCRHAFFRRTLNPRNAEDIRPRFDRGKRTRVRSISLPAAMRDRAQEEGPLAVEATTRFFIIDRVTKAWGVGARGCFRR